MSDVLAKTNSQSPPTGGGKGFNPLSLAVPFITMLADNWLYDKRQQKQFEREDAYWQRNADYNTASSQVARLKDAGLSPNLAYGSVDSGNMSAMPSKVDPRGINLDPMTQAQIANINAQTRKTEQETDNLVDENAVIKNTALKIAKDIGVSENQAKLLAEQINETIAHTKYYDALTNTQGHIANLRKYEAEIADLERQFFDETYQERIQIMAADASMSALEVDYLASTLSERILGVQLDNALKRSQDKINASQKEMLDALVDYYEILYLDMSATYGARMEVGEGGRNYYQANAKIARWTADQQWSMTYIPMLIDAANVAREFADVVLKYLPKPTNAQKPIGFNLPKK